jgi:hypothetical protein
MGNTKEIELRVISRAFDAAARLLNDLNASSS